MDAPARQPRARPGRGPAQGPGRRPAHGLAHLAATVLLFVAALASAPALAQGGDAQPQADVRPQADTQPASDVQLQDQAFEIARKLRCPVCVAESVADSNAQIAQEMRELIQDDLRRGMTEPEIMAYFQARYGDWILLDPPKRGLHLVVWLLPVVAAVAGVVFLAFKIRSWRAAAEAPVHVDPEEVQRVRDAMRSEA